MRATPRAEHVGSLLRPASLKAVATAVGAHRPGHSALQQTMSDDQRAELAAAEDEAIAHALQRQLACGLDVVTDGEMRRTMFANSFYDAVSGLRPAESRRHARSWRNSRGEHIEYPGPPVIQRRLAKVASPGATEVSYLADLTDAPIKVTFPAGSWFVGPLARHDDELADYRNEEEMQMDALDIERDLIAESIAAGARYIQLDFPSYVLLIDPSSRQSLEDGGTDTDAMLERLLWADRYVVDGSADDVTFGLHLCRGNNQSSWMFEGALDPIAERFFELPYDTFLVEWDDVERAGGFSCLRHLPEGKRAVLGLISTKDAALEDEDEIVRRVEQAAHYVPLDRLAISPQCGFASSYEGNLLSEDDQWRKLELVGRLADRLWPR
ncbi:MAG TPA: cobalamin-independent methionine synthase II family protein [Baekduia sp.]|nr:cobalamin-independent methionine synthase II family protein [Baekduia sp.]